MSDAEVIELWGKIIILARKLDIDVQIKGDHFWLYSPTKGTMGVIESIKEVYTFLCGYQWARKVKVNRPQAEREIEI
jgi:hypothetical protein